MPDSKSLDTMLRERQETIRLLQIGSAVARAMDDLTLPFIICTFDVTDLRFINVSASVQTILGYDRQHFENKTIRDFVHQPDLRASVEVADGNLSKTKSISSMVNRYKHADGSIVELFWIWESPKNGKCLCITFPYNIIDHERP